MIAVKSLPIGSIEWLNNAILISLFTDQRVQADEPLLDNKDQRGHWGDVFQSESLGSKLWLLKRSKFSTKNDLVNRAKAYAEQALKWLVAGKYVKKIEVLTERSGSRLNIQVTCTLPDDYEMKRSFEYAIA